jgi:hypothetical protein
MDPVLGLGLGVLVYVIGFVLVLVLTIVWIILPFAIFGTKPLLRELIVEVRQLRILLAQRAADRIPVLTASRDE